MNETKRSCKIKEWMFAICAIFLFVSALPATVVIAIQSATIGGPTEERIAMIQAMLGSLRYKDFGTILATLVLGWVSFVG